MPRRFYLDTSIFIDYFEDRSDRFRPLGEWAHNLLALIKAGEEVLVVSDLLREELAKRFPEGRIDEILQNYGMIVLEIEFTREQFTEALKIARERGVPCKDAIHAIIARDSYAILVARDNHFERLLDIAIPRKPEELI